MKRERRTARKMQYKEAEYLAGFEVRGTKKAASQQQRHIVSLNFHSLSNHPLCKQHQSAAFRTCSNHIPHGHILSSAAFRLVSEADAA